MIVVLTVRFAISLEEVLSAELLVAVEAGEVLRVPGATQGSDHLTYYWLLTRSTHSLLLGLDTLTMI